MLGNRRFIADYNPLYHFINLIRAPLLGETPALLSWMVASLMLIFGGALSLLLFARFRSRIAYWI